MAVPEQTPYIEHTGNGVTTSFALKFQCESKDHLIVLVDEIEPPIATWSLTGGNVVFTTAPAAGKKITIQRNTPFNRTAEYQSFNNSFRPQTVNVDFDRIWWKLQELGVADWILGNRITALKSYVDEKDGQLQQNINNLKGYVDLKDDELRAYLMEEIRKQGVALDQLDDYYNYLMQRLAQIAVDRGWSADFVVTADGSTQQQVNDRVGNTWYEKPLGYRVNDRVMLNNGDVVKSTVDGNTNNPNVDMTGWYNPDEFQRMLNFEQVSFTTLGIIPNTSTDLTLKINQALIAHRNLFIPNGTYIASKINIPSHTVITTQGDVVFKQKAGTPAETRLINIVDVENVHIQPRINLIGNIATDTDEQNHGLFIRGAKYVRIGDVFGKDLRGDVVYVGGTISQPVFDVEIGGVYGDNILRNVVSHTGGVNVHYAAAVCLSSAGYGTFDVEPNPNSQDCDAITLGYFKGNRLLVAGLPSKTVGSVKVGFADFNKDYQTNTTPPYFAFDAIRHGALIIHNFTYVDIRHAKFENEDYHGIRITDSAGYVRGKEVRIGTLEQKNCSLNDPNYKAYNYIGLVDSFVVESGNIQLHSSDRYGFIGSNNNAEISNLKINGRLGDGFINPVYRKVEVKSDWDVYVHTGANTKPVFENCKIEFTGSVGRLTNADMSFVRDSNIQTGAFLTPSASTCKLENTTINGQYYLSGYDKPSYKTATRVGNNYYWFFNDSMYSKLGSAPTSDTDGSKMVLGRSASTTYDPPSLAIGAQQSSIVDLAGAAVGDTVLVSFSLPLQGTQMWGEVTSANKVTVYHRNGTGSIVDLVSGTLTLRII